MLFLSCFANAQNSDDFSSCPPPDHSSWTELLHRHVASNGLVDYEGFQKDSIQLNGYLAQLSVCAPSDIWSNKEKLAYWINVYNAYTVKLIVDDYPVASIKDIKKGIPFINSVWEMDFFEIGGESFDLSKVEHGILRKKFDEPRIHFAIVCASRSCPILLNEAYDSTKLEDQLETQTIRFVNDPSRNVFEEDEIRISSIFKWFKGDFTKGGTLMEFLSKYSETELSPKAKISYLNYDWSLNQQ